MDERFDTNDWAQANFGGNDFRDVRLTKRCVSIGQAMATHPERFISGLSIKSADVVATYRFLHNPLTNYKSVTKTHTEKTRNQISERANEAQQAGEPKPYILLLGDSSDIIFGYNRNIENAGPIGENNEGQGFILHPNLAVDFNTQQILGIASVDIFDRKPCPKAKNGKRLSTYQRAKLEDRESKIWSIAVDSLGPPVEGAINVCVNDRGADIYEYFQKLQQTGYSFVVRAQQMQRVVYAPRAPETPRHLREYAMSLPIAATYEVEVKQQIVDHKKQNARKACMEMRIGSILLPAPRISKETSFIKMNIVFLCENVDKAVDSTGSPCPVKEPLEWLLQTDLPVESVSDGAMIRDMYRERWLIEEYFCSMKSGCGMETALLQDADSLKTLCGFYSVCSLFLLELKRLQYYQSDADVYEVVPKIWVEVLEKNLRDKKPVRTVRDFYIGVARMGGYLNRKCDPAPGWKRLWRGWKELLLLVDGYQLALNTLCRRC